MSIRETSADQEKNPAGKSSRFGKLIPVIVLGAVMIAFFAFDLGRFVSFDALREHREVLQSWVADNAVAANLAMVLLYAVATATSLPIGLVLTIAAGFLFGWFLGGLLVVIGATIGATVIFLAARYAFADLLRAKVGGTLKRMEAGFREDALSYMLVLRLVPLFPFWLVNIAPAFLGVTTRTYILATFFGIVPGTFVYATVGDGLGVVFDRGETPDLGIIFEPTILGAIIGMAVLAMVPVIYKKIRRRHR
ncbi:TVP38/TMEM64 family protein [Alphaproteobacteria bacterium HT1-32]|nr:TVP38/TMEM64 family protein [Alphaproteobacteria bacterium HT1-32]